MAFKRDCKADRFAAFMNKATAVQARAGNVKDVLTVDLFVAYLVDRLAIFIGDGDRRGLGIDADQLEGLTVNADNVSEPTVRIEQGIARDLFAELCSGRPFVRRIVQERVSDVIGEALFGICGALVNVNRELANCFRNRLHSAVKRRAFHRAARRNDDASAGRSCAEQIEQQRIR